MLTGSFIAGLLCIMEAIIRTLGSWPYLALSSSTAMTTPDLSLLPSSSLTFLSQLVVVVFSVGQHRPNIVLELFKSNFNEESISRHIKYKRRQAYFSKFQFYALRVKFNFQFPPKIWQYYNLEQSMSCSRPYKGNTNIIEPQ